MSDASFQAGQTTSSPQPSGRGRDWCRQKVAPWLTTDPLILSDGRIFAHNLTPAMAAILKELNPQDSTMQQRAGSSAARDPVSTQPVANELPG